MFIRARFVQCFTSVTDAQRKTLARMVEEENNREFTMYAERFLDVEDEQPSQLLERGIINERRT